MKIEVKNVKECKWASEETMCFEASIWIDGKKAGYVGNDGRGGSNRYDFEDRELEKKFYAHCKSLPRIQSEFGGYDSNADNVIDDLIEALQKKKEEKRWCRNALVFKLKGDKDGEFRTVKTSNKEGAKKFVYEKYGKDVEYILNERI